MRSGRTGRRVTVAVAVATLLGAALAACGGGSPAADRASSIVIATGLLPSVADPDPASAEDGNVAGYLSRQMAGTLFAYTGSPENPDTADTIVPATPEMATGAEASPDGLTWTVDLRQGALSEWGNPFTSADVVWTIDRALDRQSSAASNLALANVDPANPVTVIDDHTVAFNLTKPSPLFQSIMAIPSLTMYDSKAVTEQAGPDDPFGYEWLATHSASFGPYTVGTAELPGRIVMPANPNYWRGPAAITSLTFVQMADASTRLQAVLNGEVDYVPSMDAKTFDQVESSPNAEPYIQTASGLNMYVVFSLQNPEVTDVRLRQAINLAVDRTSIIDTALGGMGTVSTGCLPAQLEAPTTAADAQPTAQVDAARALVDQVSGPRTVTLGFTNLYPGGTVIPELIRSNLAEVGIEVVLKPYSSFTTYFADLSAGKFGMGMGIFAPYVPDASYMIYNLLRSGSPYNSGSFSDPAFDAATEGAWSDNDPAARARSLATACDIINAEAPWVQLGLATGFTAINKRITPFSATTVIAYNMRVDG